MTNLAIALMVFLCVFGSAAVGWRMRERLPDHHLSDQSIDVVKLATSLIATMAALVLGLLISSAKSTFDSTKVEIVQNAAKVVQFDRALARYGPETDGIRHILKANYADMVEVMASRDARQLQRLNSPQTIARGEDLQRQVENLVPGNETQRALKTRALQIMDEVFASRWLTVLQANGSIPMTLLVILVVWLSIIFGSFGLFAPRNGTVIAALFLCALSTSAAILLIEELNRPLDGLVGVSIRPMSDTLERLGQ